MKVVHLTNPGTDDTHKTEGKSQTRKTRSPQSKKRANLEVARGYERRSVMYQKDAAPPQLGFFL